MITYQQQLDLVNRKLATQKINGNLTIFKYHRDVMFKNLWNLFPDLLECRGHTYDNTTKKLVQLPPKKTFNYLENNTWKDKPLNTEVSLFRKYNGFMLAVTEYNNQLVFSTTGTTNSDYVKLGEQMFYDSSEDLTTLIDDFTTCIFEVCSPTDPHIVEEEPGVKFLGYRLRNHPMSNFIPVGKYERMELGESLEYVKQVKHEGFMMYHGNKCCKLKSPYYIGKKKLMRMADSKVQDMYQNKSKTIALLPETWQDTCRQIVSDVEITQWLSMDDQQRRLYIEQIKG